MRYMVQLGANTFNCFDSEELKKIYEGMGVFVIDLENWAV